MHHRDDFDGGDLLALFGFEEEEPEERQPAEPRQPANRSGEASSARADEGKAPPRQEEPPRRQARRRAPGDLRDLSGDDIVRAIVLADVLGPPPGRRGGRRQ